MGPPLGPPTSYDGIWDGATGCDGFRPVMLSHGVSGMFLSVERTLSSMYVCMYVCMHETAVHLQATRRAQRREERPAMFAIVSVRAAGRQRTPAIRGARSYSTYIHLYIHLAVEMDNLPL